MHLKEFMSQIIYLHFNTNQTKKKKKTLNAITPSSILFFLFGYLFSNDEDTPDSLDIKPPQVLNSRYISKQKKSSLSRDKKHSREHRHRRDRSRERNAISSSGGGGGGDRDRIRQVQITSSGRGSGSNDGYIRGNDQRYHSSGKLNSGLDTAMDRYEKMSSRSNDHYSSKSVYKEREREREKVRYKDYDRKRESPDKLAAERDLRSRLLNKRNKQDGERRMDEIQSSQDYVSRTASGDKEQRYDMYDEIRSEKESYHHKQRTKKSVIEVIDSPEDYQEIDSRQRSPEDPELIARRAKLLDANREMDKRKEKAREELEARRELRRGGKDSSPHRSSRHSSSHKRKHHIKENTIVNIDNTDDEDNGDSVNNDNGDDRDDDDEEDDDTASESGTNTKSDYSESEHSEGELPTSPLSVGELTKSEHRRNRKSRSSSKSITSHSRSRSRSARSRSSRSRSRSISRSHSRSPSHSPHTTRNRNRQTSPTSDVEKEKKTSSSSDLAAGADASKTAAATSGDAESSGTKAQEPPEEKLPSYYPGLQGCRSVEEFKHLNHIAEGTYGIVYRAQDKRTEEIVALKRLKMEKEREGFPITSLREINTLLKGQHPNIVTVREIVVGCNMDKIFIVMDYVEHDFKTLMETMKAKNQSFLPGEVKCLTQQLLRAVAHLHDNWILHRDLKTSNLLLSHKGILKVGDFGLAREYGSPLKPYTSIVVTLWYRAPELLLCCKEYSTPIDMWSVGCIFAEFLSMSALFPGQSETDQLNKIFKVSQHFQVLIDQ